MQTAPECPYGQGDNGAVFSYDLATNEWNHETSLPGTVRLHQCLFMEIKKLILIFGGIKGAGMPADQILN